jgi:hypothetical protein
MLQLLWLTLLAAHIGAAAVWWWVMPGGFPSSSTQFWLNQVAPPLVAGVLLMALFARGKLSERILPPILATLPIFWIAFAISSRIVFFESFRSLWNLPLLGGVALGALWLRQFRFRVKAVSLLPVSCSAPRPRARPITSWSSSPRTRSSTPPTVAWSSAATS